MKDVNLKSWVDGLLQAAARVEGTQDGLTKKFHTAYLLGYVKSAKYLI